MNISLIYIFYHPLIRFKGVDRMGVNSMHRSMQGCYYIDHDRLLRFKGVDGMGINSIGRCKGVITSFIIVGCNSGGVDGIGETMGLITINF